MTTVARCVHCNEPILDNGTVWVHLKPGTLDGKPFLAQVQFCDPTRKTMAEASLSTPALRVPSVTMQMLLDAGFNAFGLQLFCESFANLLNPIDRWAGLPFSFSFRGLRFTVEREPGEEIDTRHH